MFLYKKNKQSNKNNIMNIKEHLDNKYFHKDKQVWYIWIES